MSWETMTWARNARTGSPARKAILLVLAEHADEQDSCYPSQATIAEATEQSERSVRAHIAAMADAGLLRVESRGLSSGGRANRYYLLTGEICRSGVTGESEEVTGEPTRPDRRAVAAEHQELQMEHQRESAREILDEHFEAFWRAYPRNDAKPAARKLWPGAVKAAGGTSVIIEAAARYAADPNRDPQFTPYPQKWLREERWNDGPLPPRRGTRAAPAHARIDEDRDAPAGRLYL